MDIANLVSNVGFPVALCIYLIYNQTQIQKQYKEEQAQILKQHKEEMEMFAQSINNNTRAIEKLERSVEKWLKDK